MKQDVCCLFGALLQLQASAEPRYTLKGKDAEIRSSSICPAYERKGRRGCLPRLATTPHNPSMFNLPNPLKRRSVTRTRLLVSMDLSGVPPLPISPSLLPSLPLYFSYQCLSSVNLPCLRDKESITHHRVTKTPHPKQV